MPERLLPRYPVYIISKGRWNIANTGFCTARFLKRDGVPFRMAVEPQEFDRYAEAFGADCLIRLPFSNLGKGGIPARNFVWEHSISEGHEKHWILDDNMAEVFRCTRGQRIRCDSGPAFRCIEDFSDRYENLALSGMNYEFFGWSAGMGPFTQNVHVYSCILIRNDIPYRWRGRYNEDTDLSLQVLSGGWCTALVNAFLVKKAHTMMMKGGNTDELYKGDGRLKMARSLERVWPHVVYTDRRFKRPQHVIVGQWSKFDTPLRLKPGIDLTSMVPNEYGLEKRQLRPLKVRNKTFPRTTDGKA